MKKSNVIGPVILFAILLTAIVVAILVVCIHSVPKTIDKSRVTFNQEIDQEIDDGETSMQLIVKAPETCAIGEMVTIDATASNCDKFEWKVIPETNNFRVITNGQEALFCAGASGTYIFIIAATREGILMPLKAVTVIVETKILPQPVIVDNAFTIKVKSWLPSNPDLEILEKLAKSFERVASAGHKEVADLVKITALSNRGILGSQLETYKPFLIAFSEHLKVNYADATVDNHIELWFNLAATLRAI